MGLGKTISCLAHMCDTLSDAIAFAEENNVNQKLNKDGNPIDIVTPIKCAKTTLIIAPLSTVSNWEEQLATHIKPDILTTYIYHGTNREGSIERLAEYDCIVTTYSTLSQDFMRLKKNLDDVDNMARLAASPLHHLNFFRIILDEAHVIKDTSTNQSIAACALSAQRRLCLTGTPLQNRLDDYAALVKFLRVAPFENKHVWTNYIGGPLKSGNQAGLSRLQILTSATTLRRSKTQKIDDKPILDLPAKNETTRYIYMSAEERQVYELTRKASKNMVENITTARQMREYINILQAIMRLRQICCHRALLAGGEPPQSETVINGGNTQSDAINVDELDLQVKKPLSPQQAYQLFELMKDAGQTMCVGCRRRDIAVLQATGEKDPASTKQVLGYLTPCAEPLCHTCVQMYKDYIPGYHDGIVATCPVCGALAEMKMFELKERDAAEVKKAGRRKFALDGSDGIEPSSKLMVLMNDLDTLQERSKEADKPLKSVVFSQWTSMLDLVEIELRKRKVGYCRLDGSMKRVDRTSAILSFQSDPETVVMLVSIKAGGVG
jgi:SNF2 family DNA or RNA helicase